MWVDLIIKIIYELIKFTQGQVKPIKNCENPGIGYIYFKLVQILKQY